MDNTEGPGEDGNPRRDRRVADGTLKASVQAKAEEAGKETEE